MTAAGIAAGLLSINSGCGGSGNSIPASKAYNVLFVVTDQEHFLANYPQGTNYRARQLLAEMGTTFEKHYACSNMSTSSRSTIFTGRHITHTGMIDNTDFPWQTAMDDTLRTIGDMMNDAGYYSAMKGKWHLGKSTIQGNDPNLTSLDHYGFNDWGGTDYIGSVWQGNQKDPVIVSEAIDWLGTKGKNLNAEGKPFFLMLTMINPHDIMDYDITGYKSPTLHLGGKPSSDVYSKTYTETIPSTWNFNLSADDVPGGIKMYAHNWGILAGSIKSHDIWKDYQDYYFNCIQDSDNNLMNVINSLRENGMLDNTIIIFTADHGEMHGSHALKGKGGFIYENNIHVPLVIVHPDVQGGRKVSAVTSHIDLAATLAEIAGLSENLPGKSLMPLMRGEKDSVREGSLFCYEMLSMSTPCVVSGDSITYPFQQMARGMSRGLITSDGYKFIRYFKPGEFNTPLTIDALFASNDVQLFNLNDDPQEVHNLATDRVANRDLIIRMNDLMNSTISSEIGSDDGAEVKAALQRLRQMRQ